MGEYRNKNVSLNMRQFQPVDADEITSGPISQQDNPSKLLKLVNSNVGCWVSVIIGPPVKLVANFRLPAELSSFGQSKIHQYMATEF